jgi:hypothetical protein
MGIGRSSRWFCDDELPSGFDSGLRVSSYSTTGNNSLGAIPYPTLAIPSIKFTSPPPLVLPTAQLRADLEALARQSDLGRSSSLYSRYWTTS